MEAIMGPNLHRFGYHVRSSSLLIAGHGTVRGTMKGLYHDRWVGPHLDVTIQPERPVTRVAVHGRVPDDIPPGGRLTLRVGDRTAVKQLAPGVFALSVDIKSTEAAIPLAMEAAKWVTPEGLGGRRLAFRLEQIELTHPD